MLNSISYKDNPEHYRRLIKKINDEVDFPSYLSFLGYNLLAKSAGSMEFSTDKDRIVLNISRSPVSYFNRNDSEDKGLFFKYLRKRKANFYETVNNGLEIINSTYENDNIKVTKKTSTKKSLEDNYNIVPLSNPIYLTKERQISIKTINSEAFKGRIFNAFHYNDNQSRIANIAFPKFDIDGNPKNYIIYNRPYTDRKTGETKKFKLVLNKHDQFLFHSNLPKNGVKRILFGECGIDVISYCELNGKEGDFYIAFGGNVYKEKLESFNQLTIPIILKEKPELISVCDNDKAGYEYDLKVFSNSINNLNPNIYFENVISQGNITIKIHYDTNLRNQIACDSKEIAAVFKTGLYNDGFIKSIVFLDKLILEFYLPELMKIHFASFENMNAFKVLLLKLNELYLPMKTNILKSKSKDWNQDLKDSKKKSRFIALKTVELNKIQPGDKIELKTACGPEGSKNIGIVEGLRNSGALTNFGLSYLYMIPFNAIKTHLKLEREDLQSLKENNKDIIIKNQIKL